MPAIDNIPVNISMYVTYKKNLDYFLMMNFLSWNYWVTLKRHFQGFLSTIPSGLYPPTAPRTVFLHFFFFNLIEESHPKLDSHNPGTDVLGRYFGVQQALG